MKKNLLFLITVVFLSLIPIVNFGQAPNLGTTSGYALFTAVGAFNNDGESVVTGDVGTNVGAFNAFPPGTLVGQKHVLDGASTTAATDVHGAYGYLAALTPLDIIDVGLGGQILGPGVHFTGSGKAATLNGTLTLDGGGNPDALFIMRIDGALATSANSNVVLINSANACNVYWQVNGQFDLETYSVFQGTLIASGAINLFVGSSLNGRGLSTGGAITVHTSVVTVPVCNCFVPAPTATLTQPTCVTATATITVKTPTGTGFTYSINGSNYTNTTGVFTQVPSGTYTLTAKNSDDCISAGTSLTINTPLASPAAPTATLTQPTCVTATGTITVTAPTETGMTYSIGSAYQSSLIFSDLTPATYTVFAKNLEGCISSGTSVTINTAPTTLTIPTITLIQPACLTASKPAISAGTITVTSPTGAGMTYSIDGSNYTNTTGVFTQVAPGTYTVTAKSPDDCLSLGKSVTIKAPPDSPVSPTITLTQPTCTVPTGTITVTAPTGMIYCIINTTISNTTGIFTQMAPGRYRIITKNAEGCISVPGTSIELFAPQAAPAVPTVTLTQPTYTVPTGTINVTSPSGTGFTYSIDGSTYTNTTGIFTLIPAGTYTLTAKNLNDCISSGKSVTINALPETPAAPTVTLTQSTCLVPKGTITVSAPTGTGMTYSINGSTYSNTSGLFTQVSAGTYIVTAKNSEGGISTGTSVTINVQPGTPAMPTVAIIHPTYTLATGTINVSAPTGTGMTYSINGSTYTNTSGMFTLVNAGTYTVTAKNPDGCISSGRIVTINPQPEPPPVPTVTVTQPTCLVNTGTITVSAPTGTGMTYSINGSTYTNNTGLFTTLPAGVYSVTAKNSEGGISTGMSVTINAPLAIPTAPTVTLIQPTCAVATGTITVTTPTGAGMTYSINGSTYTNTTGIFTLVSSGSYTVTVKFSDGCISTGTSVTINVQPGTPAMPTVAIIHPTYTLATGTINVSAPTGTGMTYSINGSTYTNTSGMFTLVNAGTYTVTAKNPDGCISSGRIVTINPQPEPPPVPTVTVTQPTCLVNTGTITVSAPTGTGMTYSINGSTYTNNTGLFTTLPAGVYSVTAKNSEGGISTGMSVTINAPLAIPAAPTVTLAQPTCAVATGTITVTTPNGTGMTYSINGSTYSNTTGIFTLVSAGSYTVTSKNSNGCVSSETSVTLNTPASSDGCISTGTIVTINSYSGKPTAAGSITGTNVVCQGQAGLIYTVPVITNTTDYIWSLPAGATITAGANTNSITVVFSEVAVSGNITVHGSNSCGTGTVSAPVTITVNNCNGPDLSVVKTVNFNKPIIGHNVIFTIVATNNGPTDASGVIVTDILQSGYTYVPTTSTAGTYDPSSGVWTIGTLNNGISKSLTITAKVCLTGNYDNTATINGNETDVNTGNNVSLTTTNPTDFFIPEGFSPNGDGTNDLFVIRGIENYPDNKIIIFDSFGTKVYETNCYKNVWDGKSVIVGEDDLAIGTYFYLLDLADGSVIIKGTVYLSR